MSPWPRTHAEIDRSTLCGWLEPAARQYAEMAWWPSLPERDLFALTRMMARHHCEARHGHGLHATVKEAWREIADTMLRHEIEEVGHLHDASAQAIFQAALQALRDRQDRIAVTERALTVARSCAPPPPPWLVKQAIERAAKDYRFESGFWRKRGRTA